MGYNRKLIFYRIYAFSIITITFKIKQLTLLAGFRICISALYRMMCVINYLTPHPE